MTPDYRLIKTESATTPTGWPTVHPHWCYTHSTMGYSRSLAYCTPTLGGAFDRCWWRYNRWAVC